MRRIEKLEDENRLEQHVRCWVNRSVGMDDSVERVLKDLGYGGCASGMVSDLVYTGDIEKFFKKYEDEITSLVVDYISDCGLSSVGELFSGNRGMEWEENDPFCKESVNRVLLAYFAFEVTASNVASMAGLEI